MLKRIFLVVLTGALFFVAVQFASVLFYAWEFDDFAADEVKFAPLRETDAKEHLVGHLSEQGHNYGLEVTDKDITVNKHTDIDSGITTLSVAVNYTMPVDLYYFVYPIHRHVVTTTMY